MPDGAPVGVAKHFEHAERPAQQRIGAVRRLEHHELARLDRRGNLRRVENEHAVSVRQPRFSSTTAFTSRGIGSV